MGGDGSGAWQRTEAAREQARRRRIERGATDIDKMAKEYNEKHPFFFETLEKKNEEGKK